MPFEFGRNLGDGRIDDLHIGNTLRSRRQIDYQVIYTNIREFIGRVIHIEYDTDKKTYSIDRIENTATDRYFTFHVDTTLYYDISQYSNLLRSVDEKLNDGVEHVRIKVEITDDKDLNKSCIDNLVNKFQGNRRVKVDIENKYVKKLKKERTKELNVFKDKYKYIFDNDSTLPDIFKQFIFDTKGIDVPEEEIAAVLNDLKIERV